MNRKTQRDSISGNRPHFLLQCSLKQFQQQTQRDSISGNRPHFLLQCSLKQFQQQTHRETASVETDLTSCCSAVSNSFSNRQTQRDSISENRPHFLLQCSLKQFQQQVLFALVWRVVVQGEHSGLRELGSTLRQSKHESGQVDWVSLQQVEQMLEGLQAISIWLTQWFHSMAGTCR